MKKKVLAIGIIFLFIASVVSPMSIGYNVKTINEIVFEDVINDRIEDMYGYKYDDKGHFFKNPLVENNTNLVNTYNNGPGEINPIWISLKEFGFYTSMKAYKGYIYVVGYVYYSEDKNFSALLAKFNISDGEFLWMKTWEGFNPGTRAYGLEIYNDSIYTVGETGPPGSGLYYMDSFICKYDLDGNLLWSRLINESNWDYFWDVEQYDNHLYICGDIEVTLGQDAWILKYDMNGDKIWGKTYKIQGTSVNRLKELEIYDGYIYVEGYTYSSDNTHQDVLVVKFSLDGELIWNREWGGEGAQLGALMDMSDDGFIYIAGYGSKDFIHINDFIWKFDINGNLKWVATTSLASGLIDVVFWNGDVYGIGEDRTFYRDALLAKVDDQGNLIWYLTYKSEDPQSYAGGFTMDEYEDYFYLVGSNMGAGFIMKYDVTLYSDNNKPNTPSKPSGPTSGKPGEIYEYESVATDPDDDFLSYCFSWDDGNQTIVEWFNSGETVSASYSWSEIGKYNVRVRARDERGFVSDWSDPLKITISKSRAFNFDFNLLSWLFEQFPNLFPILQMLFQRLGLQ